MRNSGSALPAPRTHGKTCKTCKSYNPVYTRIHHWPHGSKSTLCRTRTTTDHSRVNQSLNITHGPLGSPNQCTLPGLYADNKSKAKPRVTHALKSKKPLPRSLIQADDENAPGRTSRLQEHRNRNKRYRIWDPKQKKVYWINTPIFQHTTATQIIRSTRGTPQTQSHNTHSYWSPNYDHTGDQTTTRSVTHDPHTDLPNTRQV